MKLITYSKIGYNHPSGANWTWGIWKVDVIDTDKDYCMSYTVKENFGGDSRFRTQINELIGHWATETKGVFPEQKLTGIKSMDNMEDEEFIKQIIEEFKR